MMPSCRRYGVVRYSQQEAESRYTVASADCDRSELALSLPLQLDRLHALFAATVSLMPQVEVRSSGALPTREPPIVIVMLLCSWGHRV